MFKFPTEVKFISARLKNAHFQCFAVGGCIRDQLIGKEPKDFDLVTDATPEQVHKIFDGEVDNCIDIGAQFGIVTIIMNGKPFEIAMMRTDVGSDGRHPDLVEPVRDIEFDLARRDLTINSLAFDLQREILRDPFAGSMDIDDKVIEFVGNAEERIKEDHLRILRAFRFKSQLGFKFSEPTYHAIQKFVNAGPRGTFKQVLDSKVSQERITAEFSKILAGKHAFETISMMASMGLLFDIIPELEETLTPHNNAFHTETFGEFGNSIFAHIMHVFKFAMSDTTLSDKERIILGLSALLHDIAKNKCRETKADGTDRFLGHDIVSAEMAESILTRMKFPTGIIKPVVKICRLHMDCHSIAGKAKDRAKIRRFIATDVIGLLVIFCHADTLGTAGENGVPNIKEADAFKESMVEKIKTFGVSLPPAIITGNHLLEAGFKPSVKFSKALKVAFDQQLRGVTNEKHLLGAAISSLKN